MGRILLAGDASAAPIEVSLAWGGGGTARETVKIADLGTAFVTHPLRFRSGGTTDNGRLEIVSRGTGTLVPREQRRVVTMVSGRVEGEPLKPGVNVTEATVLLRLVNPDAEEAAAAARAQYQGAAADLASLKMKLQQEVADQRARVQEARGSHELAALERQVDQQLLEQGAGSGLQAARSRVASEERAVRLRSEEERLAMLQDSVAAQLRAEESRLSGLRSTWARRQQLVHARLGHRHRFRSRPQPAEVGTRPGSLRPAGLRRLVALLGG